MTNQRGLLTNHQPRQKFPIPGHHDEDLMRIQLPSYCPGHPRWAERCLNILFEITGVRTPVRGCAGLSFCPLRYTITEDGQIVSDVRYKVPVVRLHARHLALFAACNMFSATKLQCDGGCERLPSDIVAPPDV